MTDHFYMQQLTIIYFNYSGDQEETLNAPGYLETEVFAPGESPLNVEPVDGNNVI